MKYIIAFLLIIAGCSHVDQGTEIPLDYDTVYSTISKFEAEFQLTVTTAIDFETEIFEGGTFIGGCLLSENRIVLKESYWKSASVRSREALLFHELGHCVLGLGHAPDTIMDSFIGISAVEYFYGYEESIYKMKYVLPRFEGF